MIAALALLEEGKGNDTAHSGGDPQGTVHGRAQRSSGAPWKIAHVDFLGDNVSLALHDPRDGKLYAALDHGHFGVKVHRSTAPARLGGDRDADLSAEARGLEENDMWGRPLPGARCASGRSKPAARTSPASSGAARCPAGCSARAITARRWEMVALAVGPSERKAWMGGGADLPGLHSIVVDPRNSKHVWIGGFDRRRLDHERRRARRWSQRGEGMRADHMPPELTHDPIAQDVALPRAVPGRPRRAVGAASQRHLRVFRRRRATAPRSTKLPPSVFGFAVAVHPREPDTAWFVPEIKDEKRIPVDGRLVVVRAPATAARRSTCCARACRSSTPTISSTATRWRYRRTGRPAGLRLDDGRALGVARTRATAGAPFPSISPRSIRCVSSRERPADRDNG